MVGNQGQGESWWEWLGKVTWATSFHPDATHARTANTFTKVSSDWGSRLSEGQNPSPEQLRVLQSVHLSCLYSLGSLLCLRPT